MRLIIRSQLIPIPLIWQLGAVDQRMPSDHFPVVPGLQTSFLPYKASSPKLLAEARAADARRPSNATLLCVGQNTPGEQRPLREKHFKDGARESEGESVKGRAQTGPNNGLPIRLIGRGQKNKDQWVKLAM